MTCFHNIRRDQEQVKAALGDLPVDELYLRDCTHDGRGETGVAALPGLQDPGRGTDVQQPFHGRDSVPICV